MQTPTIAYRFFFFLVIRLPDHIVYLFYMIYSFYPRFVDHAEQSHTLVASPS